jgi:hypothetical protein
MTLPFLTAIRRKYPPQVAVYRDYTVTYTMSRCSGDCCRKTKLIRALSHQDARNHFQAKFPLAWVLLVD